MATTAEPTDTTLRPRADRRPRRDGAPTRRISRSVRWTFERRALRPDDVAIKITYAGICHSDLHTCRNDWGGTQLSGHPRP